ncbi:unnamed protein product [Rotaria sp. Silwood2]|nr:unnamed protein product [Rotaria sp. Silwood2]
MKPSSSVQLTDLPDEILMMIFKKFDNITLLYSLSDVNIRLNKIVYGFIFTNRLTLLIFVPIRLIKLTSLSIYYVYSLPRLILDRYCLHILPKIHENVTWLDLESSSMERILLATNYPNLSGIALYNIQLECAIHIFSGKIFLVLLLTNISNQIKSIYKFINSIIIILIILKIFEFYSYLSYE